MKWPHARSAMLSIVAKHKKAVMCLTEEMCVSDKFCSGMRYRAVDCELDVQESTVWTK